MKKKAVVAGVILITASSAGIWAGLSLYGNRTKTVTVYPVASLSSSWWGESSSIAGTVVSEKEHSYHAEQAKEVAEVYVTEGQEVKAGDPLFSYDQTLARLNLELEEINEITLEMRLKKAQNQLEELKQVTPVAEKTVTQSTASETIVPTAPADSQAPANEVTVAPGTQTQSTTPVYISPMSFEASSDEDRDGGLLTMELAKTVFNTEFKDPTETVWYDGSAAVSAMLMPVDFTSTDTAATPEEESENPGELDPAPPETEAPVPETDPITVNPDIPGNPQPSTQYSTYTYPTTTYPTTGTTTYPTTGTTGSLANEDGTGLTLANGMVDPEGNYYSQYDAQIESGLYSIPGDSYALEAEYTEKELAAAISYSENSIRTLNLDIRESKLRLKSLSRELEEAIVTAVSDGTVTHVGDPEKGEENGTAFVTVSNKKGLSISGSVDELTRSRLSVGDVVTGTAFQSGESFKAVVTEISDYPTDDYISFTGDEYNTSYYGYTAYVENPGSLKNKESVEIVVGSLESEDVSVYLDKAYVRTENGQKYVYKVGTDGTLQKTWVKTGVQMYSTIVEITDGLSYSDYIAFPYGKDVKEGVPAVNEAGTAVSGGNP